MKQIEREARRWGEREIMTLEQAEEHMREQQRRHSAAMELRRVFGIRDRDYTVSERKYVDSWLEMGFGEEAIELALDRTIANTGQLKWQYMNKILLSLARKGPAHAGGHRAGGRPPQPLPRPRLRAGGVQARRAGAGPPAV